MCVLRPYHFKRTRLVECCDIAAISGAHGSSNSMAKESLLEKDAKNAPVTEFFFKSFQPNGLQMLRFQPPNWKVNPWEVYAKRVRQCRTLLFFCTRNSFFQLAKISKMDFKKGPKWSKQLRVTKHFDRRIQILESWLICLWTQVGAQNSGFAAETSSFCGRATTVKSPSYAHQSGTF